MFFLLETWLLWWCFITCKCWDASRRMPVSSRIITWICLVGDPELNPRLFVMGFLKEGCPRGGGNWGTLRILREDWGTLGKIRGITTPPWESYYFGRDLGRAATQPMYLMTSNFEGFFRVAGCQMVTLLLDHKADPRCLNNLGVLLTCLFFVLPSLSPGKGDSELGRHKFLGSIDEFRGCR